MTQRDKSEMEENTKYKDGVNRNARLIVRNVSFKATEESLREHFSPYGTIEEVKLLKKPDGRLVGCAFVHFTNVPMANKAIAATNKKLFLGRPINVSWAVAKNEYDRKIQGQETKHKSSEISNVQDKVPALKKEIPMESKPSKEDKAKQRINRNARLIIRNISFKATEDLLKAHFEPYGTVLEANLLKKPDGKLVGCAFVHFKNVPMAKKALLNTNMKPFLGRPISVDWAVAKDKYMQHIVGQELEMQDAVKKEDSDDSDNDDGPINISDFKADVKSESGSEQDDDDSNDEDDDDDESNDDDDESNDDDDKEIDDDEEEHDIKDDVSETSGFAERKRIKLNDAEDGCTVFITNIPFSVDDSQLKQFVENTAPCKYALVCVDKLTEHSKGSGFVKFLNQEDADRFLALPADQLRLSGQTLQVKPALKRENLQGDNKKQPKDNRNLYLVKEGVVIAGTKAAVGVSASDMAKRLALEKSKTQMLKNLNRFVSRYRLVVSNLPPNCDDNRLRKLCANTVSRNAVITEVRVMRDLRAPLQQDGKHPSKGYGFVMFMKHEDALACLRKLNNNPEIFDRNNRPIVSFSIEDRTALNARKKRLEKSIANNPTINKSKSNENNRSNKRKAKFDRPDESKVKRTKFTLKKEQNNRKDTFEPGKFVKPNKSNEEYGQYTGLTAKEGAQHKMRSSHKLKTQAEVHRQTVKMEKKQSKRALKLKMMARERIKQPKQKVNKTKKSKENFTEKKVKAVLKEASSFTDLVSKYKSKLAGNSLDRVKAKWYET